MLLNSTCIRLMLTSMLGFPRVFTLDGDIDCFGLTKWIRFDLNCMQAANSVYLFAIEMYWFRGIKQTALADEMNYCCAHMYVHIRYVSFRKRDSFVSSNDTYRFERLS